MILVMCAVRDSATEMYGRPFFVQSRNVALRSFTDEVRRKDQNNDLNKHPDDFALYSLGMFDDNSGEFRQDISLIARAKDLVEA